MPIDALPTAPQPTDTRADFSTKAFALAAALDPFRTQANALEANVNAKEQSAVAAAAVKNTDNFKGTWSAAVTYAQGESVLYGSDYWLSLVNANLNNVPVQGANWTRVYRPSTTWVTVTGSVNASPMVNYFFTAGGALTLPAAPNLNDVVAVCKGGDYQVTVLRNGKNIQGKARDLPIAGRARTLWLTYAGDAAGGWIDAGDGELGAAVSPFFVDVNQVLTLAGTIGAVAAVRSVAIDADRDLVLIGGSALYGVVYNNLTGAFGSPVLIRNTNVQAHFCAVKSAANQALVMSCTDASGNAEAVVLTITGSSITVGTAATAALSAAISSVGAPILTSGGQVVWPYRVATPAAQLRAISIAGTTATIGAAVVPTGTSVAPHAYDMGGGVIMAISLNAAATLFAQPYTLAGTTLTLGTGASTGATTSDALTTWRFSGGRIGALFGNANLRGAVISLAGTVASISAVNLSAATTAGTHSKVFARQVGDQAICASDATPTVNVLTDAAGVATAGAEIVLAAVNGAYGGSASELWVNGGPAAAGLVAVGISGNNPVVNAMVRAVAQHVGEPPHVSQLGTATLPANQVCDANGWGGVVYPLNTGNATVLVTNGRELRRVPAPPASLAGNAYGRGADDSQLWAAEAVNTAAARYALYRTRTL